MSKACHHGRMTRAGQQGQSFSGGANNHVIIVGAGPAGLFCAREAALRGLRVLVLEAGEDPGRKLCIAGGGKANFSNVEVTAKHYSSEFPKACEPILRAFTPQNALQLMKHWNLPIEERGHGQLFLRCSAKALRDALVRDCRDAGCRIVCHTPVVKAWSEGEGYIVAAGDGLWTARGLAIAAGSPARPQCGATDSGFSLARSFGHTIIPPRPALTPLVMPANWPATGTSCADLAGICLPVRISLPENADHVWEDDLLFTHDGISGPAALKASLFWKQGDEIRLDFAPHAQFENILDAPGKLLVRTAARRLGPQRLMDALIPADLADRKCAELSRSQRRTLAAALHEHRCHPLRVAGLKRAEVCAGGVSMAEVQPRTLESTLRPRLWFMGEVLDVTGLLGGYNLHWAWASALAAARGMVERLSK